MIRGLLLLCLWITLSAAAFAGGAADALRTNLEAGTLDKGILSISPVADKGEAEALAARGVLKFFQALEHLGQAFHRHGLRADRQVSLGLPILRMPVPPNPRPEKLDYRGLRAILSTFVDELAAAEKDLAQVKDNQIKLPLDLDKIKLDLDGDGKAADYESLGAILSELRGNQPANPPQANSSQPISPQPMAVAFDTADIYWLRGYGDFLSAFGQFLLAHDFNQSFDKTFHLFFPQAGLPYGEMLPPEHGIIAPAGSVNIADAISFIHLVNWPVVEPERRKDIRLKLLAMAEMSRKSWASARAEADNDQEWLPNAKQSAALPFAQVDDVVIDTWLSLMAECEQLLEGRKLLPHWRFNRGINLKKFLDEGKNFDLVLLAAGADAIPWLEDGPLSDSNIWNGLRLGLRGNFLGYALWFN